MAVNPNPNGDALVAHTPNDTISSLTWSPTGNMLAAGSWNTEVRVWDVAANGVATARQLIKHAGPVLCTAWSNDSTRVFSGSTDKTAKMWVLGQQPVQIAQHDAPIKEIFFCPELNMVVTGSWDKTVKYWDARTPGPQAVVKLPERVYCMDVRGGVMVVGTAERHCLIYDARKPQVPFREFQSPLKFQSRCLALFPDCKGFAIGSIEGRIGISHVDANDAKKNFAFKCHRHGTNGAEVYAVNTISFHNRWGTFATAGSDGGYAFWDKDSKQRLKLFARMQQPITATGFNASGTMYAYATGYDWSKGAEFWDPKVLPQIFLHPVADPEIAPRPAQVATR